RTHIYRSAISREEAQQQQVEKIIQSFFKGSPSKMVMQALGNHSTTLSELEQIKKYLLELEKKKTAG
ncbi:MAG: BlaI/MecI/CopY family transcriptional regulator, partial [Chitinophagaceae bacterium]